MNLNLSYKLSEAYDLLYQKNFNRSYEKSRETLPSAVIEFLSLNSNFDEISKNKVFQLIDAGFSIFMACGFTSEDIDDELLENMICSSMYNSEDIIVSSSELNNHLIDLIQLIGKILKDDKIILGDINHDYLTMYVISVLKVVDYLYNNELFFINDFIEYIEMK
jgi:hypothetical protein